MVGCRSRHRFSIPSGVAETNLRETARYEGKNCDPLHLWRCENISILEHMGIVRANALENNVVLYKVEKGIRLSIAPKGLPSRSNGFKHQIPRVQWNTLRVAFKDSSFTVFLNGERLFETEDRTFTQPGKTGLWTKADSVTYFDEFTIVGK
jgi:hypothetical protein